MNRAACLSHRSAIAGRSPTGSGQATARRCRESSGPTTCAFPLRPPAGSVCAYVCRRSFNKRLWRSRSAPAAGSHCPSACRHGSREAMAARSRPRSLSRVRVEHGSRAPGTEARAAAAACCMSLIASARRSCSGVRGMSVGMFTGATPGLCSNERLALRATRCRSQCRPASPALPETANDAATTGEMSMLRSAATTNSAFRRCGASRHARKVDGWRTTKSSRSCRIRRERSTFLLPTLPGRVSTQSGTYSATSR